MTDTFTPGPWRYEPGTKTIRSQVENYWLATMDSWDGSVNNEANAQLIAEAPDMLALLKSTVKLIEETGVLRNDNPDQSDWKNLYTHLIETINNADKHAWD